MGQGTTTHSKIVIFDKIAKVVLGTGITKDQRDRSLIFSSKTGLFEDRKVVLDQFYDER